MKLFFWIIFFFVSTQLHAQFTQKIKADSVRIYNDNCGAELILENSSKNINGFLFNKGNGRTEFRAASIKLNDSLYVIGGDTLKINPITGFGIGNWNTAYSWGNHSLAGYATASNTMTFTNKTWNGTVIGSSYGGAGTVNGLLKANGSGAVSAALADADFLTPSTAASTYLTTTAAASTYLMTSTASSTYLTTSAASATYLMTSIAASTYLTPAVAASTYLTPLSASTTYLPLTGGTLTGPLHGTSGDFSSGITGTLSTAAQPNITSVGSLNLLTVTGSLNASTLAGTIVTAAQPNITSVGSLSSLSVTGQVTASVFSGLLSAGSITGQLSITNGGTGADNADTARKYLGVTRRILNMGYGYSTGASINCNDSLNDGVYMIYATMVRGGDNIHLTYSAVWLYTHFSNTGGTDVFREILAPNTPGNNNGNITLSGTTVSFTWGGQRGPATVIAQKL